MKKALLFLLTLLLLTACAVNQKNVPEYQDKEKSKSQPEYKLFGEVLRLIDEEYYRPLSYQEMVIGAAQGLEETVGTTGLIKKLNLEDLSFLAGKHSSGSAENKEIYYCLRNMRHIIEYGTENFKNYSRKDIVFGMIQGMMSKLDEKSTFLTSEEIENLSVKSTGLTLSIHGDFPVVISTGCSSPARRAGIQPGDKIVAINDVPTNGVKLFDIIKRLRGPGDPELILTIIRDQTFTKETVQLEREILPEKTVYVGEISDGYTHIWINRLSTSTFKELSASLDELENRQPIKGIVLDLRDNPGGLLDEAVRIADFFLQDGVITILKRRSPKTSLVFKANSRAISKNCRVAILVNNATASGAEIITAALQDHKRAVVLGVPTYGLRSIQTVVNLSMGCRLKYTSAYMQRPNSEQEDDGRIHPDIIVEERSRVSINNSCEPMTDSLVEKAFAVLSQKGRN